jgi:hypothetical protein
MSKGRSPAEYWRRIIGKQRASGLSVAAFCRRSRIPQPSFYLWRRKLQDAAAFTEVHLSPEPVPASGALELVLPGGRSLVVRPGFDRATLLALVDALEHGQAGGAVAEAGV